MDRVELLQADGVDKPDVDGNAEAVVEVEFVDGVVDEVGSCTGWMVEYNHGLCISRTGMPAQMSWIQQIAFLDNSF